MIKSKFKKIGIVVLVLVGIFALLTFGDWIISKIQGIDVRIKFEATNTEVKVTSVAILGFMLQKYFLQYIKNCFVLSL